MLPQENAVFPPNNPAAVAWATRLKLWSALYSGRPDLLVDAYESSDVLMQFPAGIAFWRGARNLDTPALHLPLALDVAATSASLLFAESPRISDVDDNPRVADFVRENALDAKLVEAGEVGAALGGVYLKLDTDASLQATPIVSVVEPTAVVPTFVRGTLASALFWRVVRVESSHDYVLVESRENTGGNLAIEYGLYRRSTEGRLGTRLPLTTIDETAALNLADVRLPVKRGIGVVYVPNRLPNRFDLGNKQGVADVFGSETLLDALDEAWSSWMRDIRLGLARVIVDEELLSKSTDTTKFDPKTAVFVGLKLGDLRTGAEAKFDPIVPIEFALRVADHAETCKQLTQTIVDRCGYSPASFGFGLEGAAESGTALRIRERKSMLTRNRKSQYWTGAIRSLLMQAQELDGAANLTTPYAPIDYAVELEDSIVPDPAEMSTTIQTLRAAEAISHETAIRMLHPEWDEAEIKAEVEKIMDAIAPVVPPMEGIN